MTEDANAPACDLLAMAIHEGNDDVNFGIVCID